MLAEGTVFAMIAVKDLAEAKTFYADTLGLAQADENPGGVTYTSGTGKVFVYQAPSAGTNQATSAAWEVADVPAVVEQLKAKGVEFEHYDMPFGEWQGDVLSMGPMQAAWFKDPSGNTLQIGSVNT